MRVMGRGYSAGLDADATIVGSPASRCTTWPASARSRAYRDRRRGSRTSTSTSIASLGPLVMTAPSIVSLVPTTLLRLLDADAPLHGSNVIIGGAPLPGKRSKALRPKASRCGDCRRLRAVRASGGFALDGVAIAGIDFRLDPEGGEIVHSAPVMRGYRLDPERSAEVLDADGWLHTGDISKVDETRPASA